MVSPTSEHCVVLREAGGSEGDMDCPVGAVPMLDLQRRMSSWRAP